MTNPIRAFWLVLAIALAGPAAAQDSTATTQGDAAAGGDNGLSMGAPDSSEPDVGDTYVRDTFSDWQLRCVKSEDGNDPCQLYQMLTDDAGNSVAEVNLFALPSGGEAVAGASVVTPLETLLTEQLRLTIDAGETRRYPFSFCTRVGCVARLGFREGDVEALRRGAKATLRIVPAGAPDREVNVTASLSGFTAGFAALVELRDAAAANR